MLEAIEKLLVLQDRDRKIFRTRAELAAVEPQRQSLLGKSNAAQGTHEGLKLRLKQIESDRKRLELEVESKQASIAKYSLQQFQTRKNDEYKALAHEIELCKEAITKIEDEELGLMEQAEQVQKEAATATKHFNELKKEVDKQVADLAEREANLKKQLAELESGRAETAAAVGEDVLIRYERLLKNKGENAIVGISHGVCGGCHMRLPPHTVVSCRSESEVNGCPHCGRILYYTRDMELAVAD